MPSELTDEAPAGASTFRLVEWNVAMSLHKKAHLLAGLNPTVAILPEAADSDRTRNALKDIGATSTKWVGSNPNKGLLAASFGDWQLEVDGSYDPGYQWVLPLHVLGPSQIRVVAVWEMDRRGTGYPEAQHRGSLRASLTHYEEFLTSGSGLTVISGDFNASAIWDKPKNPRNFADLKSDIESHGFVSAYHHHYGHQPGAEPDPTLWWRRKPEATYHIDYTFVSQSSAIEAVTLGSHSDWIAHSDHSPMTVDLRIRSSGSTSAESVSKC